MKGDVKVSVNRTACDNDAHYNSLCKFADGIVSGVKKSRQDDIVWAHTLRNAKAVIINDGFVNRKQCYFTSGVRFLRNDGFGVGDIVALKSVMDDTYQLIKIVGKDYRIITCWYYRLFGFKKPFKETQ